MRVQNIYWRIAIIAAVIIAAAYYAYPPFDRVDETGKVITKGKVSLGLDLQGGAQFLLKVQVSKAVEGELNRVKSTIERLLIKRRIPIVSSEVQGHELILHFADVAQRNEAFDLIQKDDSYSQFEPQLVETAEAPTISLRLPQRRVASIEEETFEQAIETIRNRIDELGLTEPVIQRQGISGNRIFVQLPGYHDVESAKKVVSRTAYLQFMIVLDGPKSRDALLRPYNGRVPKNAIIAPATSTQAGETVYYLLDESTALAGADLEDARVGRDERSMPAVNFSFNRFGARRFAELTGKNIGERLAIVLDGKVMSAPVIQSRISGNGQITGRFTLQEARDLAVVLRAGALPAPVQIEEERIVSATLGKDSIRMGIRSALLGGLLVVVFMVIYYKVAGLIADFALLLNIIILLGALGGFKATLTMPGIAGVILTIGMAVDANVLIFERIREELRQEKTIRNAVANGFSKAFWTIVDANVTTLIAAIVLMNFGTGPVRGFAITLTIGIAASMFTALFVSRVIFDLILARRGVKRIAI
jgi:preprotein translocase subunit SecD